MIKSLEEYTRYPVDKIVFSHSANSDVLEAGTMENVRFTIQYVKVTITNYFYENQYIHTNI